MIGNLDKHNMFYKKGSVFKSAQMFIYTVCNGPISRFGSEMNSTCI